MFTYEGNIDHGKVTRSSSSNSSGSNKWKGEYGILEVQVSDRQGTKEEEGFFVYFMSLLGMA